MCCLFSMNLKGLFHDFNPSKFVVYFSLLLFLILLGLRLDNFLEWNYFIVFTPIWLWKVIVFCGVTVGTLVWVKHPEYRRENSVDLQAMIIASVFHLMLLIFELLLCLNLQYNVMAYRVVFVPIYCMSTFGICACVWGYRHERQLELETFFSINILQFICLSLKWDNVIGWKWGVVFVPVWLILVLLSVCVLYYIFWALLFMRSPEITATQRNNHIVHAITSCLIVIPLATFMVMLVQKLDDNSNDSYFSSIFIPLELSLISLIVTSFYQKGGNQWWFGMRKEFCEFLLDAIPLLREYGNISFKFSDVIGTAPPVIAGSDLSIESISTDTIKVRELTKPVVMQIFIDVPD